MASKPKTYSFVTSSDDLGGFKDASVQKLVRQHAMWETSRWRKLNTGSSKHDVVQDLAGTTVPPPHHSSQVNVPDQLENKRRGSGDNGGLESSELVGIQPALVRSRVRRRKRTASLSGDHSTNCVHGTSRPVLPITSGTSRSVYGVCRLGSGPVDPFQRYPIKLDSFTKRLLHDS